MLRLLRFNGLLIVPAAGKREDRTTPGSSPTGIDGGKKKMDADEGKFLARSLVNFSLGENRRRVRGDCVRGRVARENSHRV